MPQPSTLSTDCRPKVRDGKIVNFSRSRPVGDSGRILNAVLDCNEVQAGQTG